MFDGQAYLQSEGGAIGLRLTGVVAQIVMDMWSGTMKRRMTLNYFEYFLMIKYVDDIYVFLQGLKKGMRYNKDNKKIEWHEDDEKYDEEEGNTILLNILATTSVNFCAALISGHHTFLAPFICTAPCSL